MRLMTLVNDDARNQAAPCASHFVRGREALRRRHGRSRPSSTFNGLHVFDLHAAPACMPPVVQRRQRCIAARVRERLPKGEGVTQAYLIDPFVCEVTPIELRGEPGSSDERHFICTLLGCEQIESVRPDKAGSDLIVIGGRDKVVGKTQEFFLCRLWPYNAIEGKALWISVLPDGNNANPQNAIDYVRNQIAWAYRYSNQAYRLRPSTPARRLLRLRHARR